MFIISIILIITGIFTFFAPHLIWELTEKWKSYSSDEPSDLYLFFTRLGGILVVIIGIATIIVSFIPE